MARWTAADIPDQSGRIAIVTGSNSGIGFEAARALVANGATVVLACRSAEKGEAAVRRLADEGLPGAPVFMALDLSSLASVRAFAEAFEAAFDRLDLLINNAGVMMCPYGTTADGFETQIGVNHLGHFALTGLLVERLRSTPGARVVNVASQAHVGGRIHWDDLQSQRSYNRIAAYGQSKVANLLFTLELNRRLDAAALDVIAVACHPGWTGTDLQRHIPLAGVANAIFAQKPEMGALPTLYAAVAPDAQPGAYYGPDGFYEMRGHPKRSKPAAPARNVADAARLWQVSEALTGVHFLDEAAVAA